MSFQEVMNSNLVSSIISLIGVIISLAWSASKTKKGIDQALKVYESELSKKVYASSKKLDMECVMFQKLNEHCGEILQAMQQLYPDSLSALQIRYEYKPTMNELALCIRKLEREINCSRPFAPPEVISCYESLLQYAETFFADAARHNMCWEDTPDDVARKESLKHIAYQAREKFGKEWEKAGVQVHVFLSEQRE